MGLDPQTQGDARTKKHVDVCNGYLPTELANEGERKMGCAECCDCWCHGNFSNEDGTDREDAESAARRDSQIELGERRHSGDEKEGTAQLKCDSQDWTFQAILSNRIATVRQTLRRMFSAMAAERANKRRTFVLTPDYVT
jgi:hypothetical protein